MKTIFIYILLTFTLLCDFAIFAAPTSPLSFEEAVHDFGRIREQDGPVSYTFRFVNRSDAPVVITAVETTCGCTVPSFSKRPVLAGRGGEITLTYNPADRPGAFSRTADVYDSDRRVVATLRIDGTVEPRPRSVEELYPYDAGGGVRMSAVFVPFGYVEHGAPKQSYVEVVNTSQRTVALGLRHTKRSGRLLINAPRTLAPGARAEIRLTYDAPEGCGEFRTADDEAEITVDGRSLGGRLSTNAIIVKRYAPEAKFPAPAARLNKNIINFGVLKRSGGVRTQYLTLSNAGGDPLRVEALETDAPVTFSIGPGTVVREGEELEFEVRFDPSQAEYGYIMRRLRIFTDDPARPMRHVRLTASVEE